MAAPNNPELMLYTNHGCGWCHRVHIILHQLNIPYTETLIDLSGPREPWFLELNPQGLVPVLHYKDANIDKVLTESGPIVQFLLELYPSHLSPDLGSASDTAYFRYRMNWFVDTYFTKVNPYMFKMVGAVDKEEQVKKMEEMMLEVEKIEPLLKTDGGPYFGGRKEMTYVEAMTIPFFMRLYDWSDDAIWPKEVAERLDKLPNLSKWAKHCMKQGSVTYVYPEGLRERVQERLPEAKKKYANV